MRWSCAIFLLASACSSHPAADDSHDLGGLSADVDLAGVDFAGADLAGIDFAGADLTGANPTNADLAGVDLAGANPTTDDAGTVSGLRWSWLMPRPQGDEFLRIFPYAGALYALTSGWTILRSDDDGLTWSLFSAPRLQTEIPGSDSPRDLWADASGVWFAVGGTTIVRSSDGGKSWSRLPVTVFNMTGVWGKNAMEVFVFGSDNGYQTVDGGATWTPFSACNIGCSRMWGSGNDLLVASSYGSLSHSTDGGKTWTAAGSAAEAVYDFLASGSDRYATSWSQGILHSTNGGVSFSNEALPTMTPGDPMALALLGGDVYASGLWGALVRRDATSGMWSAVTHPAGKLHLTALHTRADGTLLIGGRGGELLVGDATHGFSEKVKGSDRYMVGVVSLGPGRIVAAGDDGAVLVSSDGGKSFTQTFTANTYLTALAHGVGERLYLSGIEGEFWTSDDGGMSFQSATRPSVNLDEIESIWADSTGMVAARQSGTDYLFFSKDSGKTWTQQSCSGSSGGDGTWVDANGILYMGKGYSVCRAAISSSTWGWNSVYVGAEPKQFYADAGSVFFVSASCGVGRSTDQGFTWTLSTPAKHPYSCSSIWGSSIDDLYIAGQAGEVLHSTDKGMTWTMEETATGVNLRAIGGSGPNEVFAAGSDGAILVRR